MKVGDKKINNNKIKIKEIENKEHWKSSVRKKNKRSKYIFYKNLKIFKTGDYLNISFRITGKMFIFYGLCTSLKGKTFKKWNTTFKLLIIYGKIKVQINTFLFFNSILFYIQTYVPKKRKALRFSKVNFKF